VSAKKVLVLADDVLKGRRVLRALSGLPGVSVHVLVCKNRKDGSSTGFVLEQLALVARHVPWELPLWTSRLLSGRLVLRSAPLHDESVLAWLSGERFFLGLHDMGVIYEERAIAAFERGILNSHIGMLPEYRGRSVMEWSIVAGKPTGISVFFVDRGIDTGPIVTRREIDVRGRGGIDEAKSFLFEKDGEMYREALARVLEDGFVPGKNEGGRRYYVMSNLLRSVARELLEAPA
jgi:hypothetical protein